MLNNINVNFFSVWEVQDFLKWLELVVKKD